MFEKVVESVLEEYVSEWVDGLDSDKMKVALFAGKVEFRDLRMRGAALDKFQLPIKMKSGSVGRLSIKVPWKRLTSQAVTIRIEDVTLVVEPTDQADINTNDEEHDDSYALRARWAKQQEVRMLELLERAKSDGSVASLSEEDEGGDSDPTASWGYRKKILNTIMDNVSFEFKNISIRYEDSRHLASSAPLVLGLTIDSIVISTTNANGQAEFVDRAQARTAFVHRHLEVVQVRVYTDRIVEAGAKGRIDRSTFGSDIIYPFSTRVNLVRNHDERTASTIPKLRCSAEVSAFRARLTPQQSTFLLSIADFVSTHEMYLKRLHCQQKRPNVPISSNGKVWWQYALHAVKELHLSAIPKQRTLTSDNISLKSNVASRRCSWRLFGKLWLARKEYIDLHKSMLRAAKKKKLDLDIVMADRSRLNALEDSLDVRTIVFFRLCAAREFSLEGQGIDSPRKVSQWKARWSSGKSLTNSSNSIPSTQREHFLNRMELYIAVSDLMLASSEARTASSHEERNVTALTMALDLVVISFEIVLVEEHKVGDQLGCRDFLRFELHESVVTILRRTNSSTLSSRIASIQILDYRPTYEAKDKEPQALLSRIGSTASTRQIAKKAFVELNIEWSESMFQLDCNFERFRYIHNLHATSKLRAFFIVRVDKVPPVSAEARTILAKKGSELTDELLRKKSIESVFGDAKINTSRRKSTAASRKVRPRKIVFAVNLPEIEIIIHTTDTSAEVEARLLETHIRSGLAHNSFELTIKSAEANFLEAKVPPNCNVTEKDPSHVEPVHKNRSTLMQGTRLVFNGEKLVEGYLVPKWQVKCTAPPIQFSISNRQYQQILQALAEWGQTPSEGGISKQVGSDEQFMAEDERLSICIAIPRIMILFDGEGPIQEALSAASTCCTSEKLTGFELDVRDLNVIARFSSIAQVAAVDLNMLSLVKCMGRTSLFETTTTSIEKNHAQNDAVSSAESEHNESKTARNAPDPVYDHRTGCRTNKLFELRGQTSLMISSIQPVLGEVNIEQVAIYWDHELLVALAQYHASSLLREENVSMIPSNLRGADDIPKAKKPELRPRFAFQVRIQRCFAFFMPAACSQELISFVFRGNDILCDLSSLQKDYVCAQVERIGDLQLTSSRLCERNFGPNDVAQNSFSREITHVLVQSRLPLRVLIESAGFGSLKHRGGAGAYCKIEGSKIEATVLLSYWSSFLNHATKEIAGYFRWTDLLRISSQIRTLNDRVNLEMEIACVKLIFPTCEMEGKHIAHSDHFEIDIQDISAASRALAEDPTLEQNGILAGSMQVFAVMADSKKPNQTRNGNVNESYQEIYREKCVERHYCLGKLEDVFIETVAIPFVSARQEAPKQDVEMLHSLPDIDTVMEELEKKCSRTKVTVSSQNTWINNEVKESGAIENKSGCHEANFGNSIPHTTLTFNPYQLEMLSHMLDNNFAASSSTANSNLSGADELKVIDVEFDLGDLTLEILDPFDSCEDNKDADMPSSGTIIARMVLEHFQLGLCGFASQRSQYCASSCKGTLWKVDKDEENSQNGDDHDVHSDQKPDVGELCGSIYSFETDGKPQQAISINLDYHVYPSNASKEIRIHFDNCEFLPEIFEFGQRLRYFASIESDLSNQVEKSKASLNVSITTGIVHYLAAECVSYHMDESGSENKGNQEKQSDGLKLKMIISGCLVGRYKSDDSENSCTQLYGRNMSVKVSSQWPPESTDTAALSRLPNSTTNATAAEALDFIYDRSVCDDFTFDIELVTSEDAEATMAVTLTHFHVVFCTIDVFLLLQAQKILGSDDDITHGDTDSVGKPMDEESGSSKDVLDSTIDKSQSRQTALAPPEIEFREDSISMIQLLLEDTSITLLRQSGQHLSPIARVYTFRAMCKVTYEVGEKIDGVAPTLTEVEVEFPNESLDEPNVDDGVSIWGFNTALGSWEPIVEPWMFDLRSSLTRDQTGEITANLDFLGKEGHALNVNVSPAMIDTLCQTAKAYDGVLQSLQPPSISPTNVISSDCYLVNDTGSPITYWVTHDTGTTSRGFTYAFQQNPKRELLAAGAKVPLEIRTSISPSLCAEQTVSFCWDDNQWFPLTDIPIRNTGKYIYVVRPRIARTDRDPVKSEEVSNSTTANMPRPQLLHALLDISAASGFRTFTISSLVRLLNDTSIAVDCGVLEADGKTITEIGTIMPKDACSVPFRLVHQIWSVRVFVKPHLSQLLGPLESTSKLSALPSSADRKHRWSNELFISEKENNTLHTASCPLVLDDYACKCQKMFEGSVPFVPNEICKANGSYFHAQSCVFTSSNASNLQYAKLKLTSPLTLVNNCGVPILAILFTFKKVHRTGGESKEVHLVSSQVIPPHDRLDTFSSALQDETYCSISMTGSSWSRLFRLLSVSELSDNPSKKQHGLAESKVIPSFPLKSRTATKSVVLSITDFQSRTATLNVSFENKANHEENVGYFMIIQPRFLLRNATPLPLAFLKQPKLMEMIPGTKFMIARFAKSPFSAAKTKTADECCSSMEMEAIHTKLNSLRDPFAPAATVIDDDELQAQYYSEASAIMVQLAGNSLQSSSAQDINLEVGVNTSLRVYNEATKRYHDLVAVFKHVGGSSAIEVTFVERYLLLNQTDHEILASGVSDITAAIKARGDNKRVLVASPNSSAEFSWWAHSFVPSDVCIRLKVRACDVKQPKDFQWSGKFSLHEASETALKVSTPDASRICVLRVQVRLEAAVQVCIVVTSEDVAEFPLYRVINSCAFETIWFKQIFETVKKDSSAYQRGVVQCLAPGETVCFGWDEAYFLGTPNRELSVWYAPKDGTTSSDYHSSILLDQLSETHQVEIPSKDAIPNAPSRVYVRWHLKGLTKTMVAQDAPLQRKEQAGKKQTRELVAAHGEKERSPTTSSLTSEVVAHFRLPHFSISLVTSTPDELLLFSGQDVDVAYGNINNDHDQCEIKIGCFQLDNQLTRAIYPVVIAPIMKKGGCAGFRNDVVSLERPKSVEVRTAQETERASTGSDSDNGGAKSGARPQCPHFFHLSILRLSYDETMDYIKYFSAMMQPARIQLEETFLLAFAAFVTDCAAVLERNYPRARQCLTSQASNGQARGVSDKRFTLNSERRIYIETLQLHPVKIQLSITILNHYGETEDSVSGLAALIKLPLAVTKALLSSTFSQIDGATLYLNALHLTHAFASGAFLLSTVQQHYMLQGMRQIYSLIGAADILGNPVGLVTNLGVGVKDFFYEPAAGLVTSPQEFVLGLSRGTTSLVTHSLYGTFNAASKVTGTLSEGIATLSLDRTYLAKRRAQAPRNQMATHIGTGLIHGTKQLGKGIVDGVTGVIMAPAHGALHGGLPGFIEGVGKGLLGVAVKPCAGVLDLAATTAAGITATTSALDRRTGLGKEVHRRREPRLLRVTSDQRVRVYTSTDALVSRLLLTLPLKYQLQVPNELYDTHVFLPKSRIVVATSFRLLLLEFASGGTLATLTTAIMSSTSIPPPLVLWSHPLAKLVGAKRTATGIAVYLGSSTFHAEHPLLHSDTATDQGYDDIETSVLQDLDELGNSGVNRVTLFLSELVVRHQRGPATNYTNELRH